MFKVKLIRYTLNLWHPKMMLRSVIHANSKIKEIKYRRDSSIISTRKIITCDPITTRNYIQTQMSLKQTDQRELQLLSLKLNTHSQLI